MSDDLLCTKHTSQLHPGGGLNKSPKPVEEVREEVVVVAEEEGAVVFCGVSSEPGEVRGPEEVKPRQNK